MGKPRIVASIELPTVAQGATIEYNLVGYDESIYGDGHIGPSHTYRWFIAYDWGDKKESDKIGPFGVRYKVEWQKSGAHAVFCVAWKNGKPFDTPDNPEPYLQSVNTVEAVLAREMQTAKQEKPPHPSQELSVIKRYLELLEGLETKYPIKDAATKKLHDERIMQLRDYRAKLEKFLNEYRHAKIPFHAVYLGTGSQEKAQLRVFVTSKDGGPNMGEIGVVDWTNIGDSRLSGSYWTGILTDEAANRLNLRSTSLERMSSAVKRAIEEWDDDNRYWPGAISYEFTRWGGKHSGTFETDGKSYWEGVADILGKIALGAGMVALVLTPLSGMLAAGILVTSMVAGTTGSVLAIQQRHKYGEGNFLEDATDVVNIAGNLLGLAGVAWLKGATVLAKTPKGVVTTFFIGRAVTDGVQGVLLGVAFTAEYDKILKDPNLGPEQRADMLLKLLAKAAGSAALVVMSFKASAKEKADWKALTKQTEPGGKPIDLTQPPEFKGKTQEGKKVVTVVDQQARLPTPGPVAKAAPVPTFAEKFPDSDIWRTTPKYNNHEIELIRKLPGHEGDSSLDLQFIAKFDNKRTITVKMINTYMEVGGKRIYSPELKASELYPMMFQHFEKAAKKLGQRVRRIQGEFAFDNLEAIKKQLAAHPQMALEEALKAAPSWKYWEEYANTYGYELVPMPQRPVKLLQGDGVERIQWGFDLKPKGQ